MAKPFDVKQAELDLRETLASLSKEDSRILAERAEAAIRRIKAESDILSSGSSADLFTKAVSFLSIEVPKFNDHPSNGPDARQLTVRIETYGPGGSWTGQPDYRGRLRNNSRHRVVIFIVPVED